MKVAMLPDWRGDNPYQRLLADALKELGVDVAFPIGYRRVLPISRALWRSPPDVLHLHWPSAYLRSRTPTLRILYGLRTLIDLALVRSRGVAIVWTLHNLISHDTPTPRFERWLSKRLAFLADSLIAHGEAAREETVAAIGVQNDKITIIPHGSFRSAYGNLPNQAAARKSLGIAPAVPLALFFGMIRPYKGVDDLLRAWAHLEGQRAGAMLLIVGHAEDNAYADEIRALAAKTSNVQLDLRFVPDTKVTTLLAAANCLVLPFAQSLTSGTMRLAQDYGVPVVATRVSGTAATNAIYIKDDGIESLGTAILEGLNALHAEPLIQDWPQIATAHLTTYEMAKAA